LSAPAVELRGLEVLAGNARILGPLDLALEPGEHALVVGPSGCGKTTLLRSVAGLVTPTSGTVSLFGDEVSAPGRLSQPPEARRVGFLFQGACLWPHMSVRSTLNFALKSVGLPRSRRRARVAELLEQVELGGYEKRMPASLSGGEAQRVALARALAIEPRILLLDEPLGPLDAELRDSLLTRLSELHERLGWTALHVTHDPLEASRIASRVLHMQGGALRKEERA